METKTGTMISPTQIKEDNLYGGIIYENDFVTGLVFNKNKYLKARQRWQQAEDNRKVYEVDDSPQQILFNEDSLEGGIMSAPKTDVGKKYKFTVLPNGKARILVD